MRYFPWLGLMILLAACAYGCQSSRSSPAAPPEDKLHVRNNAASLLRDLLGDEANVSKLLIIKRDRAELNRLIKEISAVAGSGAKTIEQLAKADASLNLRAAELPPGERAARDSIAKARAGELLRASGDDFEFRLLLTQAEALSYGAHLAKIVALHEPHGENAKTFSELSRQMEGLHGEVLKIDAFQNCVHEIDHETAPAMALPAIHPVVHAA